MEGDFPWIYVAMIVIYFIAWVLKKIKGEPEEEQERPGRTMEEVEANRQRHLERQAGRESQADDPSEVLRKLFETIADEQEESFLPEPEAVVEPRVERAQPPPLKKSPTPPPLSPRVKEKVTDVEAELSLEEKQALARLEAEKTAPRREKAKPSPLQSIRALTHGRGLRHAVVLKEILDKPKALKTE